jgi:hypothetical protein
VSFQTDQHTCTGCGHQHEVSGNQLCDAEGCAVERKALPFYIVARPPWGGSDDTDLLHACSPEHLREVISAKSADYEIEVTASVAALLSALTAAP